jgi:hypothetical protein
MKEVGCWYVCPYKEQLEVVCGIFVKLWMYLLIFAFTARTPLMPI